MYPKVASSSNPLEPMKEALLSSLGSRQSEYDENQAGSTAIQKLKFRTVKPWR